MTSHPVPKVGDYVRLNDYGLEQIYGTTRGLSPMKKVDMKILHISGRSVTEPEETFPVMVDNKDINDFMIDHRMFDRVGMSDR
jgi:hypothetical protein